MNKERKELEVICTEIKNILVEKDWLFNMIIRAADEEPFYLKWLNIFIRYVHCYDVRWAYMLMSVIESGSFYNTSMGLQFCIPCDSDCLDNYKVVKRHFHHRPLRVEFDRLFFYHN